MSSSVLYPVQWCPPAPMPGPVGLSFADLGVLAAQHMFATCRLRLLGLLAVSVVRARRYRAVHRTLCFLQATLTRARLDTVAFKHTQLM